MTKNIFEKNGMKKLKYLMLTGLVILALAACTPGGDAGSGDGDTSDAYPVEDASPDRGYPVEIPGKEAFEANLTPNAPAAEFDQNTGAVTMVLLYGGSDRPVRGQLLFAAGTMPVDVNDADGAFIPVLDQNADPSAHSDSNGVVNFSFIQSGKYALALLTPLGPILVEDSATDETVVFEVVAGEITDLGIIVTKLIPDKLEP